MSTLSTPHAAPADHKPSRFTTTIGWVFRVLAAALFVYFGFGKVTGSNPNAIDTFDQIGMGQWLRVAIGSLELLGAIGLLIPLLSGLAAACLAALVVGAMGVELFVVDEGNITAPLICFVLVAVVVVLRRHTILDPFSAARGLMSSR